MSTSSTRSNGNVPPDPYGDALRRASQSLQDIIGSSVNMPAALARYAGDFFLSYIIGATYFSKVESQRAGQVPVAQAAAEYLEMGQFNLNLMQRAIAGTLQALRPLLDMQTDHGTLALTRWLGFGDLSGFEQMNRWYARMAEFTAYGYPRAIAAIEPEFGFHFERGIHPKVDETDRFLLYQVMPSTPGVTPRSDGKPILILPPYVLGANILGFLPGENRSYAHNFANRGIPTYIRILKPIDSCPALQTMTAEDDALDTRRFCETIKQRHGRQVTLNGYCQGGFNGLCDLLSGELDGLVDAFITCVSPMDGTRSAGLSGFLGELPARFNDLAYGTKTLPNGNVVADGRLMGWVYKLRSIADENPIATLFREMLMGARQPDGEIKVGKTAAALNYWLAYERSDLPMAITRVSFASFTVPITADGTLPLTLFGRPLNLKRLQQRGIPWLICYGEGDALVEPATALAPRDFIPVEVSAFPKGHVAIATSWSDPSSAYALHTCFGPDKKQRGPVRFQLDLEAEQRSAQTKSTSPRSKKNGSRAA